MEVPHAETPQNVPTLLLTGVCSVGSLKDHFKALLLKKMKLQAKDFGFSIQLHLPPQSTHYCLYKISVHPNSIPFHSSISYSILL